MTLLDELEAVAAADREAWVDARLGLAPAPPDMPDLPRGAVPYLPCGVDEILAIVRDVPVRAEDVVVDLGAGLGRVVLLVHLLTGARGHGIEIQPALVAQARAAADALGVAGAVTFEHASADDVALDGSVFVMYAPFNGAMLARVVASLRGLAERRAFTVCAVGFELFEPWLVARPSSHVAVAIYDAGARGLRS